MNIQRAQIDDVLKFNALINALGRVPLFRAIFGPFNYSTIIEFNHLSILATCGEGEDSATGFVSINDSVSGDHSSYDAVIEELNDYLPAVRLTNTMFLNFWAVEERSAKYKGDVGVQMIKKLLAVCPDLDYLIWLCPRTVKLTDYQKKTFAEVECSATHISDSSIFKNARVLVLRRDQYLPRLLVREAVVEDNDDLLPILRKCHPTIMQEKDSYFLANLIQSRDEGNKFYVGLKADAVVGMLTTSQDVNVNLIKTIFDVDTVSDIILRREPKAEPPIQKIAIIGDFRSMPEDYLAGVAERLRCICVDASQLESNSRSGESEETAGGLHLLDQTIAELVEDFKASHSNVPPTSCIIKGFPRTEADVKAVLATHGFLDFVVEATSSVEVGAALELDAEEDAAFVAHMDAAEILRGMYHSEDDSTLMLRHHLQWATISRQHDDITSTLHHELWGVVSLRESELIGVRGLQEHEEDLFYSNAFAITMFCTETEFDGQASDMLRVAFEDYAHLDYCLCMVPNSAPVLPLLELMTSVKLRPGTSFNQSLYVMRKEALMAREALRVVRLSDALLDPLVGFLGPLDGEREELMKVAECALKLNDTSLKDNPQDTGFVVLFDQEVVGFVALSRKAVNNDDITRLRAAYELDGFVDYERHRSKQQTAITQWVLSPVFSRWSRFIFREIMRQNEKTVLYFQGLKGTPPATEVVEDMIPVSTRRRAQGCKGKRSIDSTGVENGPLFIITKNRVSLPKRTVNSRIVVVGGTNYAYSLLEVMCMSPDLTFSNVIVVTERAGTAFAVDDYLGGAGHGRMGGSEFSGCLSLQDTEDPMDAVIHSLGLPFKATLVRGHLTDIDRDNRSIVVSDELAVEYDVLVIASPCQDNTVKTFPASKGLHPTLLMDRGIFGLGNPSADERALKWVFKHCLGVAADGAAVPVSPTRRGSDRSQQPYEGGGVVIYGHGIDVLVAAGALMKHAVPAVMITVVMPDAALAEIGHGMINESIHLALRDSGVAVYMGHVIRDIQMAGNNNGAVTGIKLESCIAPAADVDDESSAGGNSESKRPKAGDADNQPVPFSLPCKALICCGQKQCDADVFAAINESGLVYDGGVVVDQRFRTVDRHIYAVGSYSRFSRCYKEAIPHHRFNSRELGAFVGRAIIESQLAPEVSVAVDAPITVGSSNARIRLSPPAPASSLPPFALSRTVCANLPGKLTLLVSGLPSAGPSRDVQPLITGEPGIDMVCVLKLDYLGVVTELVYVGTSEVEEQNLSCVVGLHESYLGSALHSFEQGIVQHWTEFFRQDWTGTIYHDKLWDLIRDLRSSVLTDKGMLMVLEKVFDIAASTDDDQVVAAARRKIIGDRCTNVEDVTKLIAESRSMEFLKHHKHTLTSYFVPLHGSNAIK